MEEYKYLPPKYSYSLKDLASDYGVYERTDVASVISASTNMSLTTASGFNIGFSTANNNNDLPLREKEISFPLSPIKEQISKDNLHQNIKKQNSSNVYTSPQPNNINNSFSLKYQHQNSNSSDKYSSINNGIGGGSRFKNPVYNELGPLQQTSKRVKSKKTSPKRERSYEQTINQLGNQQYQSLQFGNQQQQQRQEQKQLSNNPPLKHLQEKNLKSQQQTLNNNNASSFIDEMNDSKMVKQQQQQQHPSLQTTINNNNIVININKNYNNSKLKQVQEESLEEYGDQMTKESKRSLEDQQLEGPSTAPIYPNNNPFVQTPKQLDNFKVSHNEMSKLNPPQRHPLQPLAKSSENQFASKGTGKQLRSNQHQDVIERFKSPLRPQIYSNSHRFTIRKSQKRKLRSLSPQEQQNIGQYGGSIGVGNMMDSLRGGEGVHGITNFQPSPKIGTMIYSTNNNNINNFTQMTSQPLNDSDINYESTHQDHQNNYIPQMQSMTLKQYQQQMSGGRFNAYHHAAATAFNNNGLKQVQYSSSVVNSRRQNPYSKKFIRKN